MKRRGGLACVAKFVGGGGGGGGGGSEAPQCSEGLKETIYIKFHKFQ